jgi:antitoxin HicB
MIEPQRYIISDGQLVLTLEVAEEGGFIVTSPLDPELVTEAESISDAFENARDAAEALNASRRMLVRQLPRATTP